MQEWSFILFELNANALDALLNVHSLLIFFNVHVLYACQYDSDDLVILTNIISLITKLILKSVFFMLCL